MTAAPLDNVRQTKTTIFTGKIDNSHAESNNLRTLFDGSGPGWSNGNSHQLQVLGNHLALPAAYDINCTRMRRMKVPSISVCLALLAACVARSSGEEPIAPLPPRAIISFPCLQQ